MSLLLRVECKNKIYSAEHCLEVPLSLQPSIVLRDLYSFVSSLSWRASSLDLAGAIQDPNHHSLELTSSMGPIPRESRSAGLDEVGTCLQLVDGILAVVSLTRLLT